VSVFFGDATAADLIDTAPPDPAAVARHLYAELRARVPVGNPWVPFDALGPIVRAAWRDAVAVELARLRAERA
jgi:hypothetical protein